MKLFVLVKNFGLINDTVEVFTDEKKAEEAYAEYTQVDYAVALEFFRLDKENRPDWDAFFKKHGDRVSHLLDADECEQTKIFEVDLDMRLIAEKIRNIRDTTNEGLSAILSEMYPTASKSLEEMRAEAEEEIAGTPFDMKL